MRVLFIPNGSQRKPSARMRVYELLPALRGRGVEVDVLEPRPRERAYAVRMVAAAPRWDAVVIQKRLFRRSVLAALRAANPALIYDFDDAIYTRQDDPEGRPAHPAAERLDDILAKARRVTAGNPTLAAYAKRITSSVTVVPTVIDTSRYQPRGRSSREEPPVIGWAGTTGNLPMLELLRPALLALREEGLRFRFRVLSPEAPSWNDIAIEFEPWTLERNTDAISEFDIGVTPLTDTPWNRGKCGLKALEYMALRVATIASPVGVLTDIVDHGNTGLVARDEKEWHAGLRHLVQEHDLRRRLGDAGRRVVEERYSIDVAATQMHDVFESVCG